MFTEKRSIPWIQVFVTSFAVAGASLAQETPSLEPIETLDPVIIRTGFVANETPAVTFANPVSLLRYNPQVDVQSRNFAEAQGDISIRGGTFEDTGILIGVLSIYDPQTGHYLTELPIDPDMLQQPEVLTGFEHQVHAFNATAGSIRYGWRPIGSDQGLLRMSVGPDGFHSQSLYLARKLSDEASAPGIDFAVSRSVSDGPIHNGDHRFHRASLRYSQATAARSLTVALGYQDKFFGWPNLYTPFNVPETEDIQTFLGLVEYRQELSAQDTLTIAGYYRQNRDDYEFDRRRPGLFNPYEHETRVGGAQLGWKRTGAMGTIWHASGSLWADSMDSTSLNRSFQSRTHTRVAVGGEFPGVLERLSLSWNVVMADTNRESVQVNPALRLTWDASSASSSRSTLFFGEYSRNSQVPGYTATASAPTGLFAGNAALGVSRSDSLEWGMLHRTRNHALRAAVFARRDRDLTDWTFSYSRPNARTANALDVDTVGAEILWQSQWAHGKTALGYTYLHKEEAYRQDTVDASFYALNVPVHRATYAWFWQVFPQLELRLDSEWRLQRPNGLRQGGRSAFFSHFSLTYRPIMSREWWIQVSIDNLWDEDFQRIPAVPATPRQFALQTSIAW
jgi:vitamin B12 transporter